MSTSHRPSPTNNFLFLGSLSARLKGMRLPERLAALQDGGREALWDLLGESAFLERGGGNPVDAVRRESGATFADENPARTTTCTRKRITSCRPGESAGPKSLFKLLEMEDVELMGLFPGRTSSSSLEGPTFADLPAARWR